MKVMIDVDELKDQLAEDGMIVLDVRMKDEGVPTGEEAYQVAHIPRAIFLDVKKDVTGETAFLPEANIFADKLASLGVSEQDKIVIYDEGNHRAAAKVWVALYYLGHEHAYVLNGGIKAWRDKGYELSPKIEHKQPTTYATNIREEAVMSIEEVKNYLNESKITLIDSRSSKRYSGEVEPKYNKAGHIPGAVNYETKQTSTEEGKIKDQTALQMHFKSLNKHDEIVVSCGSGNSAAVNMLALKEAGYENVALFSGGFQEWIEDDNNKVATKHEK